LTIVVAESVVEADASAGSDATAAMAGPGAILAALRIELPEALSPSADSAAAAAEVDAASHVPPLVVELHTATWCQPCRPAEQEVGNLSATWPAVAGIAHHSSDAILDELSTTASRDARTKLGAYGFPTILLNGVWALNGSTQSRDLSSLVGNVTAAGGLLNSPSRIDRIALLSNGWQWNSTEERLSINWSLAGSDVNSMNFSNATIEAYLIRDGVDGGTLGFLPDVVVAGSSIALDANGSKVSLGAEDPNASASANGSEGSNGSASANDSTSENGSNGSSVTAPSNRLSIDVTNATSRTGLGGQRIVLILRAAGSEMRAGSASTLFGQQDAPPPLADANTLTDRYPLLPIFVFMAGVLLMVPALSYTLPTLFTRSPLTSKNLHSSHREVAERDEADDVEENGGAGEESE
jgi:thiol-disulfide isomerase/thioredoxin